MFFDIIPLIKKISLLGEVCPDGITFRYLKPELFEKG
jgi:hypothetical protein